MCFVRFKRKDGSFSAWGDRDDSGSTWLTAFVTKCFLFSQQLLPTLIENKVVSQAMRLLVSQQTNEGTFLEPGRVIHKEMQARIIHFVSNIYVTV